MADAMRKPALASPHGGSATVRLTLAPAAARASLRAAPEDVAALSSALGVTLPQKPKTSASGNDRHALWLGPDEWLLIGPDGTDFVGLAAKSGVLHSAVDISHRNIGIVVSGPGAATAVSSACPQDLSPSVFPVGACSRTVFGKMEIVLYRPEEDTYRVECWRSFADYCFGMLSEGAADADL
ncbi:sarcosine oxidase subunit gamma [Rhizobium sp. KVB221]|uniref:Sarcosine oxidase subunit gamma n=1 Tax=Rhizobium setariae TaxID=2801340 RepID=A0A936YL01_9HYPH|nr:sarcosine oxidase subunit gamma [Rhizobium setariae]MBL0372223.1 sarcosine oxidase subunit gamma [Rhizobium setariae]